MYRIELELSNRGAVKLEQFRFTAPGDVSPRITTRSGSSIARGVVDENLFYWVRNRKALVLLLLKVASEGAETARLRGDEGSAAALLVETFSTRASWLVDFFGESASGKPVASQLFQWHSDGSAPGGRYEVRVRADLIARDSIHVYLNGRRISVGSVLALIEALESPSLETEAGAGNALVPVAYKHYSVHLALDPERHRAEYVNECRFSNSGDEPLRFIHWNLGGTERSEYREFVVTTARGTRLRTSLQADAASRQRYLVHLNKPLAPGEETTIIVQVVQPDFRDLEGSLYHESCTEPCSVDLEVTCPPRYQFDRYAVFAEKNGGFAIKDLPKPKVSRDPVGGRVVRVSLKNVASAPLYRLLWSCTPATVRPLPGVFAHSLLVAPRQSRY